MKILTFILSIAHTNCYFAIDDDTNECVVIDPADDCERLYSKITERGLNVKYILLTHGHFDHMMALDELREKTGAPMGIHKLDEHRLYDPMHSYMLQMGGKNLTFKKPDFYLNDGDIITFGATSLKVIHTPGHSMGSVCFLSEKQANGHPVLFAGDTLFAGGIGRYDLSGSDGDALMKSLARLAELSDNPRVCPGHGRATYLEEEKASNPYLMY